MHRLTVQQRSAGLTFSSEFSFFNVESLLNKFLEITYLVIKMNSISSLFTSPGYIRRENVVMLKFLKIYFTLLAAK